MNIILTPTDEDNLLTALGITEFRSDELKDIMNRTGRGTNDMVTHMIKISKEVPNDNEMAFCIFQLGANAARIHQRQEAMEGMEGGDVMDQLRKLLADRKKD